VNITNLRLLLFGLDLLPSSLIHLDVDPFFSHAQTLCELTRPPTITTIPTTSPYFWGTHVVVDVVIFVTIRINLYRHPMKPQRLRLTHQLLLSTGVYPQLRVLHPHSASQVEMENFHLTDYVQFIKKVSFYSAGHWLLLSYGVRGQQTNPSCCCIVCFSFGSGHTNRCLQPQSTNLNAKRQGLPLAKRATRPSSQVPT